MKILIIGAGGMLGSAVVRYLSKEELIVADRPEWDITKEEELRTKVLNILPDLVINCAAFTNVEAAESQRELVFQINARGPLYLATITRQLDIPLLHISTDYVFDGQALNGYNEDDVTSPLNVYGQSKEQAEKNITATCQKYYIIRSSWLFGPSLKIKGKMGKKNFVDKMLESAQDQKVIKVVNDQYSKPTYTNDLAVAIRENFVKKSPAYGFYHLANEGSASWLNYAEEIFKQKKMIVKLLPVPCSSFFTQAKRPKNSSLNNNKLPKLRPWPAALADYLKKINH